MKKNPIYHLLLIALLFISVNVKAKSITCYLRFAKPAAISSAVTPIILSKGLLTVIAPEFKK